MQSKSSFIQNSKLLCSIPHLIFTLVCYQLLNLYKVATILFI